MLTRTQIIFLLSVIVIAWAGSLWMLGLPFSAAQLKPFAFVVTILSFGTFAFNKWCWKWPVFRGWLVNRPRLEGVWNARLKSDHNCDGGAAEPLTVDATFVISQTYTTLSMRMQTAESVSNLVASVISQSEDEGFDIFGVYRNEPGALIRERSSIHYGSLKLRDVGHPVDLMEGYYWTDRGTKGTLILFRNTAS